MKLDKELSAAIKKFIINELAADSHDSRIKMVPSLLKIYIEGEGAEDEDISEPELFRGEEVKPAANPVDNEVLPGKWYLWDDRRPTDYGRYLVVKKQSRKAILIMFNGDKKQFKNVRCFMKLPEAPELEIGEWE